MRSFSDKLGTVIEKIPMKEKIQKFILAFIVLSLTLLFYVSIEYFSSSNKFISKNRDVVSLTDRNLLSRVEFNVSEKCVKTNCWAKENFNDKDWTTVRLPYFNVRNHPSYNEGLKRKQIFYRLKIKIPEKFKNVKYELAFTPQHIYLDRFDVFLQGQLIASGNGKTSKGNFPIYSLPKEYLKSGIITIGIKGTFDTNSSGIFHNEKMFIGNLTSLSELTLHIERSQVTYHLYWLLTLGTIIIFFSLLYFFTKKKNVYGNVIVYTLSVFLAEFFKSEFVGNLYSISTRLYVVSFAKAIAALFIIKFFSELFKMKIKNKYFYTIAAILIFCPLYFTFDYSTGGNDFSVYFIFQYLKSAHIFSIFLCLILSIQKMMKFQKAGKKGSYQLIITVFLLAYTLFYSYFFFSPHYVIEPILDLILCFFIATNTILEFGSHEKTIMLQQETLRLQTRDVAIGKTAAMMAHDVRKPFAQIKAILEDFDHYKNNNELLKKAKLEVTSSLTKVESMVSDVMDYSREANLELKPISIESIIKESLQSVSSMNQGFDLPLEYHFNHQSQILGDHSRLIRCFENLLGNATEAQMHITESNSRKIKIETHGENGEVLIRIKNHGNFLPNTNLDQIFNPFFTSGKATGTGLGLASVKKIIEQHNGSVKAYNLKEEDFICFELHLKSSENKKEVHDSLPLNLNEYSYFTNDDIENIKDKVFDYTLDESLIIKLCDDSEIMREYLKSTLDKIFKENFQNIKYKIESYEKGEDLIESLNERTPHLLFTDYHMEKSGGIIQGDDVIKNAKAIDSKIYCILVSSLEDDQGIKDVIESGVFEMIKQPLQREELIKAVNKFFIDYLSCA